MYCIARALVRQTAKDSLDHIKSRIRRHGFGDRTESSLDSCNGVRWHTVQCGLTVDLDGF